MTALPQPAIASGAAFQSPFGVRSFVWVEKTSGEAVSLLLLSNNDYAPLISADGLRAKVDSASAQSLALAGFRLSANQVDG